MPLNSRPPMRVPFTCRCRGVVVFRPPTLKRSLQPFCAFQPQPQQNVRSSALTYLRYLIHHPFSVIALDTPPTGIYTAEHLLALCPARPNETATDRAVKELLFTNADPLMLKTTPMIGRPRGSSLRAARAQAPGDDTMEDCAPHAQPKAPTAKSGRKRARGASLRQIKVPRGDVAASPRSAGPHYRGVPKSPTAQVEGNWRNPRRAPTSPSMRD